MKTATATVLFDTSEFEASHGKQPQGRRLRPSPIQIRALFFMAPPAEARDRRKHFPRSTWEALIHRGLVVPRGGDLTAAGRAVVERMWTEAS